MLFTVDRVVDKSFYKTHKDLVDAFALGIFQANDEQGIAGKSLLYHPVKLAVVFKFTIYSFKIL